MSKPVCHTPNGRRRYIRLVILLAISVLISACGYQFAGRGDLPGGIQTLSVRVLENRTSETGAEIIFSNALINELNRRRRGSVVEDTRSDGVLQGTITTIVWETVARTGINTAAERRVRATISLVLTDMEGNELWKRDSVRAEQAYVVVDGNKSATESNRRRAIATLSEQMAEEVYRRLTDNF